MTKVSKNLLQTIILAPTREIAVQIEDVIKTVGKHIKGLQVASFIGGLPLENDIEKAKGCHIAVGAPGRLKHLIEKGHLDTNHVRLFVLDEADKLMEKCFQSDINYMYYKLPENKQILAVSATYPNDLEKFLERYMQSPIFVAPEVENPVLLGLRQFVSIRSFMPNVVQQMKVKNEEVIRLLSKIPYTQCLIFFNFQQRTESVSNILNQKGWNTMFISAAQTQTNRLKTFNSLKTFKCRILLSTDLTARGIDASNVDLVINYDVPYETSTYLHRMGRAGRYGSRGLCISILASDKESQTLQKILGEIGGTEFSIPKLPNDDSLLENIWDCDLNSFSNLYGTVRSLNTETEKQNLIKQSVFELKNFKHKKTVSESVSTKLENLSFEENAVSDANCEEQADKSIDLMQAEGIKDWTKDNEENLDEIYSKIDTNELLQSLVSGNVLDIDLPTTKDTSNIVQNVSELIDGEIQEEIINPACLYPWVPIEESVLSNPNVGPNLLDSSDEIDVEVTPQHKDSRKRKILAPNSANVDDNAAAMHKKYIVSKNVALYAVTDLLSDHLSLEIEYEADAIDGYLKILEKDNEKLYSNLKKQFEVNTCEDILQNITNYTKNCQSSDDDEESKEDETEDDPMVNIFKLSYEYVTNQISTHWKQALNITEEGVQNDTRTTEESALEVDVDSCEDKQVHDFNNQPNASSIANTSVEQLIELTSNDNSNNYLNTDTFTSHFDYYSDVLVRESFNFEDVSSFNNWFEEWKAQVQCVTDYAQQNMYLEEMNYYQYNRGAHSHYCDTNKK